MDIYRHCLCAALVFLGEVGAGSVPTESSPELLPVHQEAIRTFLKALPTNYDDQVISKPKWGRIGPLPSIAIRIGKRGPFMELDAKTGTVYFFSDGAPLFEGDGSQESLDTVMSADEAFDLARPVLQQYRLPVAREKYSVIPDSSFKPTVGQGRWEIRREFRYQNMESVKSFVEILIRAHTERVEFVAYYPPVPPRTIEDGIARLEAVERTRAILTNQKEFPLRNIVVGEPAEVTKVICMPSAYKGLSPDNHPYHSRFFWSVPFTGESSDAEMRVWEPVSSRVLIDIDTGKEISELTPQD